MKTIPRVWRVLGGLVLAASLGLMAMGAKAQDDDAVQQLMQEFSYEALQAEPPEEAIGNGPSTDLNMIKLKQYHIWRMEQERTKVFHVSILSALAFASLIFVIYMITSKTVYTAANIVNVTGLILIIYGTIALTLMAETEQQLTAAMGILGAVAGYLFGTIRRGPEPGDRGASAVEAKSAD